MIKDKQIIIQVFDEDILKVGTKLHCKYRDYLISNEKEQTWREEFDAVILEVKDEILRVKSIEPVYLNNPWSDNNYSCVKCNVEIQDIIDGWWVIEII